VHDAAPVVLSALDVVEGFELGMAECFGAGLAEVR